MLANMGNWEFHLDTMKFTFSNRIYDMLGTTSEEMGGPDVTAQDWIKNFVHPEDADVIPAAIQEGLQSP